MSDFRDAQKYAEGKEDGFKIGVGHERRRLYKTMINPLKLRIDQLELQLENAEMDAIHGENI